jgi:glycerol-3-phosphate dehydrogenase (NAD(P)+)
VKIMREKKVVILGYGEMGHAFECLLDRQSDLYIWTREREADNGLTLETLVADASFVVFCLPVVAHEAIALRLAHCLPEDAICISIAKGLDEQGRPAIQIMNDILPEHRHVLIYGPMISEEIRAGRPSFAQLGTVNRDVVQAVYALFEDTSLYLQKTEDIIGISWAVILKNVYAILFGVADQLALGDNMRGFLMTQSLAELSEILRQKGGESQSAFGLAGLGDLTTTATSESSHHHSLGRCLAQNDCAEISGEGVHTLAMVLQYRIVEFDKFPLFGLCHDVIGSPERSQALFASYLQQYSVNN